MIRLFIALGVGFAVTQIAIAATTVYLHRGLAHRAITMRNPAAWCFRFVIWLSTGMRPRVWAAVHRKHHAHCDTAEDPHSPAILGWRRVQMANPVLYRRCANDPTTEERYARDLPADRWDRLLFDHAWAGLAVGTVMLCIVLGPVYGLIAAVFHAVCYLQLAGAVNAVGHHFGRRPHPNSATNLQWLAFLTGGEGLHNNHHAAPTSATFKLRRREIDPGWWLIRAMRGLRLVTVRLDRPVFARRPSASSAAS